MTQAAPHAGQLQVVGLEHCEVEAVTRCEEHLTLTVRPGPQSQPACRVILLRREAGYEHVMRHAHLLYALSKSPKPSAFLPQPYPTPVWVSGPGCPALGELPVLGEYDLESALPLVDLPMGILGTAWIEPPGRPFPLAWVVQQETISDQVIDRLLTIIGRLFDLALDLYERNLGLRSPLVPDDIIINGEEMRLAALHKLRWRKGWGEAEQTLREIVDAATSEFIQALYGCSAIQRNTEARQKLAHLSDLAYDPQPVPGWLRLKLPQRYIPGRRQRDGKAGLFLDVANVFRGIADRRIRFDQLGGLICARLDSDHRETFDSFHVAERHAVLFRPVHSDPEARETAEIRLQAFARYLEGCGFAIHEAANGAARADQTDDIRLQELIRERTPHLNAVVLLGVDQGYAPVLREVRSQARHTMFVEFSTATAEMKQEFPHVMFRDLVQHGCLDLQNAYWS